MKELGMILLLAVAPGLSGAEGPNLAQLDALFAQRDQPAALGKLESQLNAALRSSPEDYELLWRMARLRNWTADGLDDGGRKKALAEEIRKWAELAVKQDPKRVEGHYYAAVGIGLYAESIGLLLALTQGLEPKFNEQLDAVIQINPFFDHGAPLIAKGRYFYRLPWPRRDLRSSAKLYGEALAKHPEMLRAHYYLSETYVAQGKTQEALEQLHLIDRASVAYDPPEGRRIQGWATTLEAQLNQENPP